MCGIVSLKAGLRYRTFRRSQCVALAILGASISLAFAGCGGAPTLPPVKGTVTLAGSPLPGARVVFFPKGTNGSISTGEAATDGTYSMTTGGTTGVAAGDYIVTVAPPASAGPPGSEAPPQGPMVPEKYRRKETSDITITVGEAGNPKFDIDLK